MAQTTGVFAGYGDRRSHFTRRLIAVRQALQESLSAAPPGPLVVLDICGGEGQVLLPVLAAHPRRADVRGAIVELDPESVAAARTSIAALGLTGVDVVAGDAGLSDTYIGIPRAHVVVLSGVFMHLSPADRARLVRFLPHLCEPGATFIWTIGNRFDPTRSRRVNRTVARNGVDVTRTLAVPATGGDRLRHEVGVGRVAAAPEGPPRGVRVFRFRLSLEKRFPRLRTIVRRLRGRR